MTTRRGELSVRVDSWTLLAEAKRQFPDKWHGLSDPDTRFRQRYADLVLNEEIGPLLSSVVKLS
jgi:lysyl-tRNA synthetase class 2